MEKINSLAELVLRNETRQAREKLGYRSTHDYNTQVSLDNITELFLTTTPFGRVITKEELQARILYTYREVNSDEGWGGLEITLQEGISTFIPLPRFHESGRQQIVDVSFDKWPNFFHEAPVVLQWLGRARRMLKENIWLPQVTPI